MDTLHVFLPSLLLLVLLTLEHGFPLRAATQARIPRYARNLGFALLGTLLVRLPFFPLVLHLSRATSEASWGLLSFLSRLHWPAWASLVLAIVFLDYTHYLWHWMNHRLPFLWRFHQVHHVDPELDVTTALRFHFGELFLALIFRSGQILLLGIGPGTLLLFETLTTLAAQFHHSNLKLPLGFERPLNLLLVTPRMHSIHHSVVEDETLSNFSTIFSVWDRIHASIRLAVPQRDITIGVPFFRDPQDLRFLHLAVLPFQPMKPWVLPDGRPPVRAPRVAPALQNSMVG